jgi:hypothetical protein
MNSGLAIFTIATLCTGIAIGLALAIGPTVTIGTMALGIVLLAMLGKVLLI